MAHILTNIRIIQYIFQVFTNFKNAYLYSFDTVPLNAKYIDTVDHIISKIDVIKMFPVITHLVRCLKSKNGIDWRFYVVN